MIQSGPLRRAPKFLMIGEVETMDKIKMTTPLVEMDGDEMTRVLWAWIKEKLILPFVDLKTEYYDLGLLHRNETRDQVTIDAANATKRLGVAVKCATITPNRQRMEEYPQLTEMWKSPNGTIRAILDGTAFRAPIVLPMIHPVVKNWEAPITIARHAYGDMYKAVDMVTEEPGTATLTFKGESGAEKTLTVQTVSGPAVWQGQHNTEKSIRAFARSCFQYAINQRQDLWFSTKDTISKSTTESSNGSLRRSTRPPTRRSLKGWASPTSTRSSMTRWRG